jgi:GTPase SAR1 family protein
VGNKIDREEDREVDDSGVQEFLAKHPKIKHLTTSAKNRSGVEVAFEKIALASIENKTE